MNFGSLCSGIGGLDLGLEWAGMKCKWQVEKVDYRRKILELRFPDAERFSLLEECGKHNLAPVDLICAGFPCQPFSVAGKQRGAADDRYLWPEVRHIVEELRPAWFLGENVPGIVRMALDTVLSDLEVLGYSTRTFVVPACAVEAPHIRSRVWIVAYAASNLRGTSGNVGPKTPDGGGADNPDATEPLSRHGNSDDVSIFWDRSQVGQTGSTIRPYNRWSVEPDVGRVANGVPNRVHRLSGLGDAVVPQLGEIFGRFIMQFERTRLGG